MLERNAEFREPAWVLRGAAIVALLALGLPMGSWMPEDEESNLLQAVSAFGVLLFGSMLFRWDRLSFFMALPLSIQLGSGFKAPIGSRFVIFGPLDILMVVGVAACLTMGSCRRRLDLVEKAMAAFLFVGMLGVLVASDSLRWLAGMRYVAQGCCGYFLARRVGMGLVSVDRMRGLASTWLACAACSLMVCLMNHPVSPEFALRHKMIDVPWARSNYLASFLLLLLPLVSEAACFARSLASRWLGIVVMTLTLLCVLVTTSKGAIVVCVVVYIPFMAFLSLRGRQMLPILGILLVVLGIPLFLTVARYFVPSGHFIEGMQVFLDTQDPLSQSSFIARLDIWSYLWSRFTENPVIGNGFLNVLYDSTAGDGGITTSTSGHSWFFQLLAETGILGLSFFLVSLALTLRRVWAGTREAGKEGRYLPHAVVAALAMALLHGLVEGNILNREYGFLFWFIAGAAPVAASGAVHSGVPSLGRATA